MNKDNWIFVASILGGNALYTLVILWAVKGMIGSLRNEMTSLRNELKAEIAKWR